jgi:hypothetical protein
MNLNVGGRYNYRLALSGKSAASRTSSGEDVFFPFR